MNVNPRIAQPVRNSKAMITGAFVRNAWYVAMWGDDLAREQVVGRTILNEAVALFRKADGSVAALADRCAHRFAPLHMGKVVAGDRVQCAYHGLEFDGAGRLRAQSARQQARPAERPGAQLSGRREAPRRSGSGWATSRPTRRPFPTSARSTRLKRAM